MRSHETWHRLLEWTDGQTSSEFLAAQVAHAERFEDFDPSHPLGGRDGGADALAVRDGRRYTVAAYFPRGQQTLSVIKAKAVHDFAGVAANAAAGMLFITNQELRISERAAIRAAVPGELILVHLARLVAILDRPAMHAVREHFLGIPAVAPTALARPDRLAELRRASVARCAARWQAVGIGKDAALTLANDQTFGAQADDLLPNAASPIVVWTARMGAGKSVSAERAHQAAIDFCASTERGPLPAFLPARIALGGLQEAVTRATTELGNARVTGAHIVVDGLDEVGFQPAELLLEEARVLVGTWPNTTILLTSRPVNVLDAAPEHRAIPPLTEDEQRHCIAIGAGSQVSDVRLHAYPTEVRSALALPLFALLAGTRQRDNGGIPRAPVELMHALGRHASSHQYVDQQVLRRLAVESVANELAPVPVGEVLEGSSNDELLATGLVVLRDGALAFTLPSIAQWFAAQALLKQECSITDLLSVGADLDLWHYPLALAISTGSARQGHELLEPLLQSAPGFALRVLSTTFEQTARAAGPVPTWSRAGAALHAACRMISGALGPLAQLVADVDEEGTPLPLAVGKERDHLLVGIWESDEPREAVFQLEIPVDPDNLAGFRRVSSRGVAPGASWPFEWVIRDIRRGLDDVLKNWGFPIPRDGPLAEEAAWAAAVDLSDEPQPGRSGIEIAPLLARLEAMSADWTADAVHLSIPGRPRHDLVSLRDRLIADVGIGTLRWRSPLPGPDKPFGPFVGDEYSHERFTERLSQVFQRALIGYEQLVMRWLPTLAPRLEHHVLRPARVHLLLGRADSDLPGLPFFSQHFEPLPEGRDDQVLIGEDSRMVDYDAVFRQQLSARPTAARWLPGSMVSEGLDLGTRFPVHITVYKWIARDLDRLGMRSTSRLEPNRAAAPSRHPLRCREAN